MAWLMEEALRNIPPKALKPSIRELIITYATAGLEGSVNIKESLNWIKQRTYCSGGFYSGEIHLDLAWARTSTSNRYYCLFFWLPDYLATPPFSLSLTFSLPLIGSLRTLSTHGVIYSSPRCLELVFFGSEASICLCLDLWNLSMMRWP